MKFVFYGFMVVVAYVLGKVMYVPLAPVFLGNSQAEVEQPETVQVIKVQSAMGTVTEKVDLNDIDAKDYPEKVLLASRLVLTDKNGLNPLPLDPGSPVKPLVLSDMQLEVTSPLATHLTGTISVLETDFAKGVAKKRMDRRMALMAAQGGGTGTPAPAPAPAPVPAPNPTPPTGTVAVVENPAPEPEPMPEPEPEPEPEPAPPTGMNADQIVAAMKKSLEEGSIQELDAAKVFKWEAGEEESFDGETFQVGIATYKEMTILGEKTLQAKALFREGKLDKWIHAKTGMEIR